MMPEMLGTNSQTAQAQHQYLYWELGYQVAVRQRDWKAVRPKKNAAWELYDLSTDIAETTDLAATQAEVLERLIGYAEEAHEPVRVGNWGDRTLHEKDRAAKHGKKKSDAK